MKQTLAKMKVENYLKGYHRVDNYCMFERKKNLFYFSITRTIFEFVY
jgi:hypothetical protein